MTKSKEKVIAVIFTALITSSMLVGCADKPSSPTEDSSATKYTEQISHYENLIRELEADLLLNKEENYVVVTEYKHRIDELEKTIAALNDKLSLITTNTGSTPSVKDTQPQPTTSVTAKKSEFTYTITSKEATITGYNGSSDRIEIPSQVDMFPVTSIGEAAFRNCSAVEITIPHGVTHIDWFAFSGCANLSKITIPSSVTKIDYGAFENCSRYLTIICPKGSYTDAFAASWGIPTREK